MKRVLIVIPVVLVSLLAVLLVAPGFIDWNAHKGQAVAQIKKATGLDVDLKGDLSLAIIPSPRLYLADVAVKAPAGSFENLASIERLDVNIALFPLLKGQVEVSSVDLLKPVIGLEILKSGAGNWLTPELKALQDKERVDQDDRKMTQAISLKNISIENGSFIFSNAQTEQVSELSGIDLDIEADSLQGPFVISGNFAFAGQDVEFNANAGRIESGAESLSLKMQAALRQAGLNIQYAGVAGLAAPYEVQGETELRFSNLAGTLKTYGLKKASFKKDEAVLKGILTASTESLDFKNLMLDLGGDQFTGELAASLKPLAVVSTLKAQGSVNFDAYMGQGVAKEAAPAPMNISQIVPATLSLPVAFDTSVTLAIPNAIYKGQAYSDLTLAFVKKDKDFQAKVTAADIPGKGKIDAGVALKYAARSISEKTGAEIYSDPSTTAFLKGQSQNMAQSIGAISGMNNLPYISKIKTGMFDIRATIAPEKLELKDSLIALDDATFGVSGAFIPKGAHGRPQLVVNLTTETLDVDQWKAKTVPASAQGKNQALAPALQALALPYDLDFDIGIQNAKFDGHDIKGFRVQGALQKNAAVIEAFSAQNFAGAALSAKGGISDLQNLAGIDFTVTADAQNIRTLAQTLKIDTASFPKGLGAAKLTAKGTGNAQTITMDATVSAQGGDFGASGTVGDPLGKPVIGAMKIRAKHPSTEQAIRIFAPDARYASLQKPLDFSADIKSEGKIYSLENMNATVAGTKLDGSLNIDTGGAKPMVNADLRFGDLALDSIPKGANGATGPGTAGSGRARWSSDALDTGWLHAVNANIALSANSLRYQAWDMKAPSIKIAVNNGAMDVQQNAGLFGGQMAVTARLSSVAADKALSLKTTVNLQNVAVENLSRALSGNVMLQGQGDVSLTADVSGAGGSQVALVSSLQGASTLQGRKLVLEGFDLAALATAMMDSSKPLDRLQQVLSASVSGGSTAFDTVDGVYKINGGVVDIESMAMDGPAANIVSTGHASIPAWAIDTVHTVTLKNAREIAPFKVVIKGPLDNPGNTFGKGMFETLLREKVQDQVIQKLPDLLGDDVSEKLQQFGIIPQKQPVPSSVPAAPAGEEAVPSAPVEPQQQQQADPPPTTPEEAFEGLLKGLIQ